MHKSEPCYKLALRGAAAGVSSSPVMNTSLCGGTRSVRETVRIRLGDASVLHSSYSAYGRCAIASKLERIRKNHIC